MTWEIPSEGDVVTGKIGVKRSQVKETSEYITQDQEDNIYIT